MSGLRFLGEIVNSRLNQKVRVRKEAMVGWWGSTGFRPRKRVSVPEFSLEREVGFIQEKGISVFYRFSKGTIGKWFNPLYFQLRENHVSGFLDVYVQEPGFIFFGMFKIQGNVQDPGKCSRHGFDIFEMFKTWALVD